MDESVPFNKVLTALSTLIAVIRCIRLKVYLYCRVVNGLSQYFSIETKCLDVKYLDLLILIH